MLAWRTMDVQALRAVLLRRVTRPWDNEMADAISQHVGVAHIGVDETGARVVPVLGRELDVPREGPLREHVDHLGEVLLDVEAMELRARNEREEVRATSLHRDSTGNFCCGGCRALVGRNPIEHLAACGPSPGNLGIHQPVRPEPQP